MARSNEPAVWSLFSGGGMMSAFVLPVHILIFGFIHATGMVELSHASLHGIVTSIPGKLYLIGLITLSLFHAGHRLIFAIQDLGVKNQGMLLRVVFYGGAAIGGIASVAIILPL